MPLSKDKILSEIRRLHKANGVVPGRLKLESESGIRESDWRGVYWAKYNDAVKEAGLVPNKLASAYSTEHLLTILARLTQRLGHIPTYSELRLEARKDSGMPADTVFARLGSKSQQTEKLIAYCRVQSVFADIIPILESALPSATVDSEVISTASESDGFVYLFKSGRRYKFGFTNDPDRRIRELAFQTSEPINKVHVIRTDDPSGIEAYWKKRFADKCVHNEWFELTAKDVAAFKRRKKFM